MAFSDAFARGYAIGDAAKKRRATSKYFERFKELTADDQEEEPVTEIGGIDVPASAGAADAAIPAGQSSYGDAAIPAPAPISADSTSGPAAVGAEGALPIAAPDAAGPIPVKAPKSIKLPSAGQTRTSLTQANIKELDRLAMDAARASGDIEVYSALQKTTDSFLQSKTLGALSQAQAAATNGDTDTVEKYLRKAYRYVPDGQEVKFQKKDGKLMIKDPWDGKDVELNAERIGGLATMIRDPEKWSEIVRQERKDREKSQTDRMEAEAKVDANAVDRERLKQNAYQFGRELGIREGDLALKDRQVKLEEAIAPMQRMAEYQKGMYYGALTQQAKAAAAAKQLPEFLDEAVSMSKAIEGSIDSLSTAPKDPLTGKPSADWKPPANVMVSGPDGKPRPLGAGELSEVKGLAQTIAMANRGAVGNQVAIEAGLLLTKAALDPQNFNAQIDASTGVMLVPFQGMNVPVKLPADMVQLLAAHQDASAKAEDASAGTPPWSSTQYSGN